MEQLTTNSIISHYRIVSKLGAGGMGEVWLAEDTRLGRKVALKLLPAEFTEDSERVRRFTQEAKAASALNHPHIISVFDIGESETGRFIVMEFVAGRTLRSVIAKDNSLETFFTLGGQMARALGAAHAAGITHRDIKPDNIMVRDDGYVKMLDFGLARLLPTTSSDPEAMTLAQQTTPGTVMGTLAYMSPEQATGQTVGSASDVFALGIVLYELATGRHPFKSETMIGYLHAITSQVPQSISSLKSQLPVALDDLILRMLEKDANSRPAATEVVQALQEIEKYGSSNTLPIRIVADRPQASSKEEEFRVAVLPFKYRGSNSDIEALAEGLSEDILTGLSRFSYLRVIARSSTLRVTSESADVRNVGKQLGARYVLEGSLRQAGSVLRVSVQLVDANTGAHVWAETYDRPFHPEEIFAVQDELVPKIVSSVADMHGALPRSMSEVVRKKAPDQLSPYEALLRSFGYNERFTPAELAEVRSCLERAVQEAPANGDCWAMLSVIYADEYGHWHIHQPDSLDKALTAARTAVQAAPLHSLPYYALAQALFFRKEMRSFRVAAERAVSLNPMDGATAAFMGLLIAYSGDWERGCALSDKGLQLNPNHPGWYHYTAWHDAYRKQDYQAALDIALKLNAPDNFYTHAVLTMCYAQLGHMEAAHKSLRDMLVLKPDYAIVARELHGKWIEPDLVEQLMDGLRKAGLEIGNAEQPVAAFSSTPFVSSEARSDEGFWVAVLPFKFTGSNTEVATLAEGLSEEIVTGLSRFSYLRVIARSSTLRYSSETSDVRTIGKILGARYVMEGSLRLAGSLLRLSVQLVDATTGAHLWAQTYDRPFRSEEIFAIQDYLVPRIVSTVADAYGVLPHSMSQAVRSKDSGELTPYEALLRSFSYIERVSFTEHAEAKLALERAVEQAPGDANCWAMLSILLTDEYIHGFDPRPDSLDRAVQAARRAVDADPSNHRAHQALAWALYFRKEFQSSRVAAEHAISLNPLDASTTVYMGQTIAFGGEWERGCSLIAGAIELNPNHPGWYRYALFLDAYRKGDYQDALNIALTINMPGLSLGFVALAATYGQLGETASGRDAVRELLALRPDFATHARFELRKIWDAELVEHLIAGLGKAGLEFSDKSPSTPSAFASSESRADEGFWVAVLPFKFTGSNTEVATLAEGLSEEIVTGLSRFSYLRVISRSSTLRYATETSDVRTVGNALGARYVLEGSLRIAGKSLRVSVQLVDANTGAHLWVETYKRSISTDDIFELQDDLASRIVSTIADMNGVLPHTMGELLRQRDPTTLTPYESVLRAFAFVERLTAEEHVIVRAALERAVEQAPEHSDCLAMLAMAYDDEHKQGFNPQPNSLDRALAMARRAVAAGPSNHIAHAALAQTLFFRRDLQGFRSAANRALALNPMDAYTTAFMGILIAYSGDWEYGSALAEKGMELNPNHPGWYRFCSFFREYGRHEYRAALDIALKMNMPSYFYTHAALAAAYAQLGEMENARTSLRELLAQMPDFGAQARELYQKWFGAGELLEDVLDGLRKAGLEISDADVLSTPSAVSSETRADEGFWVAVLPFKFTGSNTEVATLAEGLSEEIITGLSRFSYLRVISRSSTLRYANKTDDVRDVGKTLGARYVMEGSLRIAGSSLRTSVQLIDANTGAHLWAETYDRQFRAEEVFALQDDLVPRIVSTIADVNGVLPRSMSEVVCGKNPNELSPYEAVLRSFRYFDRVSPEELAAARSCLELAVEKAPNNADAWAMLALLFHQDYGQGFNLHPDALNLGTMAAQRAVESGPSNHLAYFSLAQARFFQKDFQSFRNAAERTVALNPMDGNSLAFMGELLTYVGDYERGLGLASRAKQINPNHPGWFWYADYFNAYRQGDDRGALSFVLKANLPGHWGMHVALAAAAGQLGDREVAGKAVRELLKLRPNFGTTIHNELSKWFDVEYRERLIDGLRKAGLEIKRDEDQPSYLSSETRADEGFWVAVLPFKVTGGTELATLAEGLSEEIVRGLSRFSYLRVIARSSTFRYASETSDARTIGKQLGASYLLEGSLRQAGSTLRIAIQLVDTNSGAHLWAEAYDRPFDPEHIFELQDDLVPRIVSTVADTYGVLPRHMSDALRTKDPAQLTAYEAVLRSFAHFPRLSAEEHAAARTALEHAVEQAPDYGDAWAMLSMLYRDEHTHGFNLQPDATGRSLAAARRAVEAAPTNHLAFHALASAQFFRREMQAFRNSAERALALNPMDGFTTVFMGSLIAYTGDWERGCALVERARELNPHHPGWYWFTSFFDAYRKRDYHAALDYALRVNLPGFWRMQFALATTYGQLYKLEAAQSAVRELLRLRPDFALIAREELGKWYDAELIEHLIDGLRKAGLEITAERSISTSSAPSHVSFETRADEGFWIAVLPFKSKGLSTELETLGSGMTEEIITGLSRFSYLRVMTLGSTLKYAQSGDLREIGRELGARYVMEGSIRQAGPSVRLTVQLVDANNGAHLWAETYDRPYQPDQSFAIQDDLIPRIVSTCADHFGVLARSISDAVRGKDVNQLTPYEALMRGFGYHYRLSPEAHLEARAVLEKAVKDAPNNADCWAMLSWTYSHEFGHGFNPRPGSLDRALAAARRAIELAPSNHLAYQTLAVALFFRKDKAGCLSAAERALALNPLDASNEAIFLITFIDDWERGCALIRRAMELNPYLPGWYRVILGLNEYRKGNYREAVDETIKANTLGWSVEMVLSAAYAQLSEREAANNALRKLIAANDEFATRPAEALGKWFDATLVEHLIEGLRKAGLVIASDNSSSERARSELTSASSSSGFISRPSIVVLPFVNRSPDPDNEYFSDGLTEEIISDLSVIKALRVISRNSSMTFKGTRKDTLSIAKELGVTHVVSGSVRKVGDDLRITAELIEVASDTALWNEKYAGTVANVFGFQEEISRKIVNALKVRLTENEAQVIADRPIDNAAAYDCYLRARHEIYLFTAEGLDRAQRLVDSGLSLIGENSLLLATRGMVSWYYLNFSIRPEVKYLDEAAAYATKALEHDPQNCFGIFLRGLVAAKRGDIESALRDIRTAHEQKPGDSMVLNELIRHLLSAGQELTESARPAFEESLRLDPLRPLNWAQAAWRRFCAGQIDDSVDAARRIFQLTDPGNPARVYAAYYLAIANVREEAIKVFDAEGAALSGNAYGSLSLFLSRALQGDAEGAVKHVTPQLEQAAAWTEYLALLLADGYSLLGHRDAAIRWLQAAVAQGFINYPYLARRDPLLVNVRSDARFAELMSEVKPRWEALTGRSVGVENGGRGDGETRGQADAGTGRHGDAAKKRGTHNSLDITVSSSSSFTASPRPSVSASSSVPPSPHPADSLSPSIAVLPFVNISNDADNEYFCDGLAEELLNALSNVESLHVAARTSAFSFKGKETDIRDIGAKLSVSTVLEGSVRKSGNHVRISAQLVNVADGYQLWSEQYDRELEDIFNIQDEISLAIVNALRVKLLGDEKKAVVKRHTENTAAYQLYLKGRFFVNQRTSESLLKAIDYFNQAIALDSNYALGYAGLADAYMLLGVPDAVTEALSPRESLTKARAAAEKALEIDASVGEIYAALAHVKWKERDWGGAENDYKRSIELNPKNPIAHFYYAVCLAGLGRKQQAIKEITQAQELDPLSLPVNASVVYVLYLCRQYDEAIKAGKKTLELDATFSLTHQRLGLAYVQKKLYHEAIAEFHQAVNTSHRAPQPLVALGHAYAVSGSRVEAEKVLTELEDLARVGYVSPYGIAAIYVGLGEKEQAFDWLEKAFAEDCTELTFLKVDPRLDPLREDQRFQALLAKAKFPQ